MVGIYKITSPSGKVYIGQSWNIEKRHQDYRYLKCKDLPKLYYSLKKYSVSAHLFETIIEIPADCGQAALDALEIFCINQFKESGASLLNIKDGGSRGKHAAQSIEKLSEKRKRQSPPTLGMKFSDEARANMSIAQKKIVQTEGRIRALRMMHAAVHGKPVSDETRKKLREARARHNCWVGKKHSEESKRKQSLKKIGHKINCKRVVCLLTGQMFESLTDAAESIGVTMKHLSYKMSDRSPIKSQFLYV